MLVLVETRVALVLLVGGASLVGEEGVHVLAQVNHHRSPFKRFCEMSSSKHLAVDSLLTDESLVRNQLMGCSFSTARIFDEISFCIESEKARYSELVRGFFGF